MINPSPASNSPCASFPSGVVRRAVSRKPNALHSHSKAAIPSPQPKAYNAAVQRRARNDLSRSAATACVWHNAAMQRSVVMDVEAVPIQVFHRELP